MSKKALCIGINDYPGSIPKLFGCVNDANDWSAVLNERGFTVQQLLDSQATKENMYQSIQRLVQEAQSGDCIVITYSGHGSWIPDLDGDEADGRDEVLCPYDIAENHPLVDDELYNIFAERQQGVRIALINDSCHGGELVKVMPELPLSEAEATTEVKIRGLSPGYFLPAEMLQEARARATRRATGDSRPFGGVQLSSCRDTEVSYDAVFNQRPNGAFTYYALRALKALSADATYLDWRQAIGKFLPSQSYFQNPTLSGTTAQQAWKIFA